jgi:tumor protein p53-inducible protein 3
VCYTKEGQLSIQSLDIPSPKEGHVLIKVITSAINRADILQKKGLYPPPAGVPEILGLEAAGIVEKLGNNCTKCRLGDKVMALLPGAGNSEYVTADENHVIKLPDNLDWTMAGAIPEVWLTAYQLLSKVAQMKPKPGQTVLVHAVASGVGTAAVQLITKLYQGSVYGTAGSEDKIKFVKDLGAADVFNYKEGDFVEKVLKATDGKGVDIVLDCVGGTYWKQNADCLSVDGRWVLYGLMGGGQVDGDILAKIQRKRLRIEGSALRTRSDDYKSELVSGFQTDVMPLFQNGTFKPIVDSVYPLGQISEAHKRVEENKNIGKVVIRMQNETKQDIEDHSMFQ